MSLPISRRGAVRARSRICYKLKTAYRKGLADAQGIGGIPSDRGDTALLPLFKPAIMAADRLAWSRNKGLAMTDEPDMTEQMDGDEDARTGARRRFLGKVGKVAVTTSAVTLMLSAGAKKGVAGLDGSRPPTFNEWH
jgi:hypothetical protein